MSDSIPRSDGLCDRCARFLHFKSGEEGFLHTRDGGRDINPFFHFEDDYPAMTELRRSASRGCGFCYMLVNAIEKQVPVSEKRKAEGKLSYLLIGGGCLLVACPVKATAHYNVGVMVWWRIVDSKTKHHDYYKAQSYRTSFKLLAKQDTIAAQYFRLLHVPFNPSLFCSENIESIRQYLSDCSREHQTCAENGAPGHWTRQALPSRLLKIRKNPKGYKISLIQTSSVHLSEPETQEPKYAALSYCWGDQEFLKSTPENIAEHYDTIMFSKLPPGFQDTIKLCWEIGIFYLWIDSLCIIQGDQSDWDRESARMKDVYANAFLTIILASTCSPLEGLSGGTTEHFLETQISYRLGGDDGCEIAYFIRSRSSAEELNDGIRAKISVISPDVYRTQRIYKSKWNGRGWTFQENYLSTKKLYVCPGYTYFACQTSSRFQGSSHISQPLDKIDHKDWYSLVTNFCSRELSRFEDRLPAISAVASLMGEGRGDYVAGLWTEELARGLLWIPKNNQPRPLQRQTTYIGPTWSWCAYDGPVSYHGLHPPDLTTEFEVLETRCTPAQKSAIYGRLSTADGDKAYLRVRAKVTLASVHYEDKWGRWEFQLGMGSGRITTSQDFVLENTETHGFSSQQRIMAMLVATWEQFDPVYSTKRIGSSWLLLRQTASIGPGMTYERVGCFAMGKFEDIGEFQELYLV